MGLNLVREFGYYPPELAQNAQFFPQQFPRASIERVLRSALACHFLAIWLVNRPHVIPDVVKSFILFCKMLKFTWFRFCCLYSAGNVPINTPPLPPGFNGGWSLQDWSEHRCYKSNKSNLLKYDFIWTSPGDHGASVFYYQLWITKSFIALILSSAIVVTWLPWLPWLHGCNWLCWLLLFVFFACWMLYQVIQRSRYMSC